VSKDRRLPETGLNDSGTAELGSFVQLIEHLDGGLPVDAGIGDADTILESRGTILGNVLPASIDVGLDHDTSDGTITSNQLLANRIDDLWLIVVVLKGVSVRTVNHDARLVLRTRLLKRSSNGLDMLSRVVGTLGTTSEDNMNILVSGGLDDGGETLLSNTHEGVGIGGRLHSINGDTDTSVSTILESDREGDTGGELTVKLRLGGTSTDSTPGDEVSDVLGETVSRSSDPTGTPMWVRSQRS